MDTQTRGSPAGMILRSSTWGAAALIILIGALRQVAAQDCIVSVDGIPLTAGEWDFGYDVPAFADVKPPGERIFTFGLENVQSASLVSDPEYYALERSLVPNELGLILTERFTNYEFEQNKLEHPSEIVFICADSGRRPLPIRIHLTPSNTFNPVLENQNNLGGDEYEYELPMPFPRGVSITSAFHEIMAYDVDVNDASDSKTLTFTIEGAASSLFEVSAGRVEVGIEPYPLKKRFYVDLKAKEQLKLTSGVRFEIVVTDNDGDPAKEARAPIAILVDEENSEPPVIIKSAFKSAQYISEVTNINMPIGELDTHENIEFEDPPTETDIEVEVLAAPGAFDVFYDDLFSAEYSTPEERVIFSLARPFNPSDGETDHEFLSVLLKATSPSNPEFLAETLVQVNLPSLADPLPPRFSSAVYTSIVDDQQQPGDLPTIPDPIHIVGYTDDDVVVVLEDPDGGTPPYMAYFGVRFDSDTDTIIFSLTQALIPEILELQQLVMVIKASTGSNNPIADTLIHVDLPPAVVNPPEGPSFQSTLHKTTIKEDEPPQGEVVLDTEPQIILDNPLGDSVDIEFSADPNYAGSFEVDYNSATGICTLKYVNVLPPPAFVLHEGIFLSIDAVVSGETRATTLVYVDLVPTDTGPVVVGDFDSPLYTKIFTEPPPVGPIETDQPIQIENPPTSEITVAVIDPPGLNGQVAAKFKAVHKGNGVVELRLEEELGSDPLNSEVIVLILEATTEDGYLSTTVVHMDMPPIIIPPPGDPGTFSSVIYVTTDIVEPETEGDLNTDIPIQITDPPGGISVELLPASPLLGSYADQFRATYTSGTVTLSLPQPLLEEAFNNPALIMKLRATSTEDPDYVGETVIHVRLPEKTCPEQTTCAPWPTCPPCTTLSPPPPTSIEHTGGPYNAAADATDPLPKLLFPVRAQLINGATGTIEYGFDTQGNAALERALSMPNKANGELYLSGELAPGRYWFRVSARHVEGTDVAWENANLVVRIVADCEDETTWFPYSLVSREIPENTSVPELLPGDSPPTDPTCTFSIFDCVPSQARDWFVLDSSTGQLSATEDTDAESSMFSGSLSPEVRLRLQVVCDDPEHQKSRSPRIDEEQITITRTQMLVIVGLENVNEHAPVFVRDSDYVGYPEELLARQILPGPIAVLTARDADLGDSVTYSVGNVDQVSIHAESGSLYPVNGGYKYRDMAVTVRAQDSGQMSTDATVQIRHIAEGQVAVLMVSDASLEDVEDVLEGLNSRLEHEWGALKASVVARLSTVREASAVLRDKIERELRAGMNTGLFLVVYALHKTSHRPLPYNDIKRELESLNDPSFASIETWEEAGKGTSFDGVNASLEAAVIALGIITGLLVIALVLVVYLLIFRKRQRMAAKKGFKNRTSFSHPRDSIAVEKGLGGRQSKSPAPPPPPPAPVLPPGNWLTPRDSDDEDDESRRKSMVTFSDQTEVIPTETARL